MLVVEDDRSEKELLVLVAVADADIGERHVLDLDEDEERRDVSARAEESRSLGDKSAAGNAAKFSPGVYFWPGVM